MVDKRVRSDLTAEMLIEAIQHSMGFISQVQQYLSKQFDVIVSYQTIKSRIEDWGMEDILTEQRVIITEKALKKSYQKSIEEGDNTCIGWVLNKWGHHVDWLPEAKPEVESEKGWKNILKIAKNALKS